MIRSPRIAIHHFTLGCLLLAAALLAFGPAQQASADAALEGTNPAQWRVVWLEDPQTKAIIVWSTAAEGETHQVRIGVRGEESTETIDCQRNGKYSSPIDLYFHHCHLEDLEPDTEYEFVMISDEDESDPLYFKTAPGDDREFAFLFGGDSRSDRNARREMNSFMARLVDEGDESEDPSDEIFCLVHGGDYVWDGRVIDEWNQWMSDHELTTSSDGRVLPIVPARGNHDRGELFNEIFAFEAGDPNNYYAINIGPQVYMITLNTETATAGAQAEFLEEELAAARPEYNWLFAQYHRPCYPAVKGPSSGLTSWVPLFEEYNLDMACEADNHTIKRTVRIRDGQRDDETGIPYIGEGGLGVPQYTPDKNRWYLQEPGFSDVGYHVQRITITEDTMYYECLTHNNETGNIVDTAEYGVRDH